VLRPLYATGDEASEPQAWEVVQVLQRQDKRKWNEKNNYFLIAMLLFHILNAFTICAFF
jgi:hypothetical protein